MIVSVTLGRDRAEMLVEDDDWELAGLEAVRDILARRGDLASEDARLTTYRGWQLQHDHAYQATIVIPSRPDPKFDRPGDWRVLGFAKLTIEEEE